MTDTPRSSSRRQPVLATVALLPLLLAAGARAVELDVNGEPAFQERPPRAAPFEEERFGDAPSLDPTFLFNAASTYSPFDSTVTWVYHGGGCRSRTAGSNYFDADLQLPEQAILDYVRVYFYDVDATRDVSVYLYRFDDLGNSALIASATGSGTPGYASAGSGFFFHRVDNTAEPLTLRVSLAGATTSDLRVCGVRVRYSPAAVFLDGFESGDSSAWSSTTP